MGNYFLRMLTRSEALHYAAYWTEGGVLEVGFNHGQAYRYYNVPLQIAVNLVAAPSAGAYYNEYIKAQFALSMRAVSSHASAGRAAF